MCFSLQLLPIQARQISDFPRQGGRNGGREGCVEIPCPHSVSVHHVYRRLTSNAQVSVCFTAQFPQTDHSLTEWVRALRPTFQTGLEGDGDKYFDLG